MLKKILKLGRKKIWLVHRENLRQEHKLNLLLWECTLNCNFYCKHCESCSGKKNSSDIVSTKEIKNAVLDIANNFNAKKIMIGVTGGEPLLRNDLFEVMEYASSLGFNWGMTSNGFLVNESVVKKARAAGMKTIDISIDGIGQIHNEFRQANLAYQKAIQAINLFAQADFLNPVRITTTVHKNNINQLDEMCKIFSNLKITDWRLLCVDPNGRANSNSDIFLNKTELTQLLAFIKTKRKQDSKIKITFGCAHFLGDEFEEEVRNNFFYCAAGINIGSILHNGDIFVCPNVPRKKHLIQGNIKKNSFSKTWQNKFLIFRDKNRTSCIACKKCNHWEECLGGSFHTWDFEKKQPKICFNK